MPIYHSKNKFLVRFIFSFLIVFLGSQNIYTQISIPHKEPQSKEKLRLAKRLESLRNLSRKESKDRDYLRQSILRIMVRLNYPSEEIIKFVGKGFEKPQKKLYYGLAKFLIWRNERLNKALDYLQMEQKVPYTRLGNDAYIPPCIACAEAEIYFKQAKFQKVIEILEPLKKIQSINQINLTIRTDYPINLELLGIAYLKAGQIDEALDIYLRLVSETERANPNQILKLTEIYTSKFGNLRGLNEKIILANKKWIFTNHIEKNLVETPAPEFALPSLNKRMIRLSDVKEDIIILIFFNANLRGSEVSLEKMQEICDSYKNSGVTCLGIESGFPQKFDNRLERLKKLNKYVKFPILLDDLRKTVRKYSKYQGKTILIDSKRNIRFRTSIAWKYAFLNQLDYLIKLKEKTKM